MLYAPQVEPISQLKRDHLRVFTKLKKGPVFLAQRGTLAAALVSIEEWNKIAARLEHLETLLRARQISQEMNSDPTKSISHEELMQKLGAPL
jgi:PHD/YefM family antitoxin component YafN of YafNO toxin-antitoxin module